MRVVSCESATWKSGDDVARDLEGDHLRISRSSIRTQDSNYGDLLQMIQSIVLVIRRQPRADRKLPPKGVDDNKPAKGSGEGTSY